MINNRLAEGLTPATSGLVDDIIVYMDSLLDADVDALAQVRPGEQVRFRWA
jgi:hypothetical protein